MSLMLWFPLNGTTDNNGLAEISPTLNNISFVSKGKLGTKSLSGGRITVPAAQVNQFLNNVGFTYCCWIYPVGDTGSKTGVSAFFGREGMTSGGNRQYSLFQYPTINDLHWSWQQDFIADGSIIAGGQLPGVFPSGEWTHLAVTYTNTEGKIYINGEVKYTFTANIASKTYTYDIPVVVGSSGRYMSDVRIYNEGLSSKEIKEIAKGLFCHYKLSADGQENLISGIYSCTSTKDAFSQSGNVTNTLSADIIKANGGKYLTFSYEVYSPGDKTANTSGTWQSDRFGIHGAFKYTNTAGTSSQLYPFAGALSAGKNGSLQIMTWQIPSDIKTIENNLSFSVQTNGTAGYAKPASTNNETWYLRNVKLEWGTKATPFVYNKTDSLYTTPEEGDTSGYLNNGSLVNWSNNLDLTTSPRYSNSYIFGATQHIKIAQPVVQPNKFTCSFWIKPQSGTGDYGIITSNYNNPSGGFWLAVNTESVGLWFYNGSYNKSTKGLLSLNTWYHCAFVWDKGVTTWYQNGENAGTVDLSSKGTVLNIGEFAIGNSYTGTNWNTKFCGSISDFRMYATALSAEEVKKLYNTPESLTPSGNLLTQGEYIEG